ncbi:MAG TPA: hypothetical protein VF278_18455 [Pirellulales bacterium]
MSQDRNATDAVITPVVANALEQTQIGRFHTKGGHGFAAEEANALADRALGRKVKMVGGTHAANGADRIVDGLQIQTKYCQTPRLTIGDAFDSQTGFYRYNGQSLEVPRDQYDECVRLMKEKIRNGRVPDITDPGEAERLVKKGEVTYKQARNIARVGTVDSIVFDAKTQAVTSSYVFAISFGIQFARSKWSGERTPEAVRAAVESGIVSGASSTITGIVAAQVLRTRVAALGAAHARDGMRVVASTAAGRKAIQSIAQASLGRAVYGAAAVNHVAKLLRSNVITSTVIVALTATPDFYRAAIARSISWRQFSKNLVTVASGVAGGVGGWVGGAALGSVVPVIGTAAGGVVGGILGALGGGWFGSAGAKAVTDRLAEDDAQQMLRFIQEVVEELAIDYLLCEVEIKELIENVKKKIDAAWLRSMYQAGKGADPDAARRAFAHDELDEACLTIVKKRERVSLPAPEQVQAEIEELADAVLKAESSADRDDNDRIHATAQPNGS